MKLSYLILSICLLFPQTALGQICSMSRPLGGVNFPLMKGQDFRTSAKDYPFLDQEDRRNRYAQFWVDADVLNVRSGPGLEYEIISETYSGDHVFAFAKQGDWVAVSPPVDLDIFKRDPTWVHLKYLSSTRINHQIDINTLKRKCTFQNMGRKVSVNLNAPPRYSPCASVRNYLWHQKVMIDREHPYSIEYKAWRRSQDNPEEIRQPFC
jgi:hypothetical protein